MGRPAASFNVALTLAEVVGEIVVTAALVDGLVSARVKEVAPPITVKPRDLVIVVVPDTTVAVTMAEPLLAPPVREMLATPLLLVRAVPLSGVMTAKLGARVKVTKVLTIGRPVPSFKVALTLAEEVAEIVVTAALLIGSVSARVKVGALLTVLAEGVSQVLASPPPPLQPASSVNTAKMRNDRDHPELMRLEIVLCTETSPLRTSAEIRDILPAILFRSSAMNVNSSCHLLLRPRRERHDCGRS